MSSFLLLVIYSSWLESGNLVIWSSPRWRATRTGLQEWVFLNLIQTSIHSESLRLWTRRAVNITGKGDFASDCTTYVFWCFHTVPMDLFFVIFLVDRWGPRWCCEAIQYQISHLLLWDPWNVRNRLEKKNLLFYRPQGAYYLHSAQSFCNQAVLKVLPPFTSILWLRYDYNGNYTLKSNVSFKFDANVGM